jgi:hypothetical protein
MMLRERSSQAIGYPLVGRFGLAHSIMAWARCIVWCRNNDASMLSPSWTYLKMGPYLRGERDKRQYTKLFDFTGYHTSLRRAWILATYPRIDARSVVNGRNDGVGRRVVVFRNADTFEEQRELFQTELMGYSNVLHHEIRRVTRTCHLPAVPVGRHIAIHVRRGDFTAPSSDAELSGGGRNRRTPIEWYREMLIGLRTGCQADISAIVYSDGTDEELQELLRLPNVSRSPATAAITDLLAIAQADLLLASGSGFSIWGSFLGQVPRICFSGQLLMPTLEARGKRPLEVECRTASEIPPEIMTRVEQMVDRRSLRSKERRWQAEQNSSCRDWQGGSDTKFEELKRA